MPRNANHHVSSGAALVASILFVSGAGASTLVADYQFTNPSNVVQDSSGNSFDGTNNGGVQGTTAGRIHLRERR